MHEYFEIMFPISSVSTRSCFQRFEDEIEPLSKRIPIKKDKSLPRRKACLFYVDVTLYPEMTNLCDLNKYEQQRNPPSTQALKLWDELLLKQISTSLVEVDKGAKDQCDSISLPYLFDTEYGIYQAARIFNSCESSTELLFYSAIDYLASQGITGAIDSGLFETRIRSRSPVWENALESLRTELSNTDQQVTNDSDLISSCSYNDYASYDREQYRLPLLIPSLENRICPPLEPDGLWLKPARFAIDSLIQLVQSTALPAQINIFSTHKLSSVFPSAAAEVAMRETDSGTMETGGLIFDEPSEANESEDALQAWLKKTLDTSRARRVQEARQLDILITEDRMLDLADILGRCRPPQSFDFSKLLGVHLHPIQSMIRHSSILKSKQGMRPESDLLERLISAGSLQYIAIGAGGATARRTQSHQEALKARKAMYINHAVLKTIRWEKSLQLPGLPVIIPPPHQPSASSPPSNDLVGFIRFALTPFSSPSAHNNAQSPLATPPDKIEIVPLAAPSRSLSDAASQKQVPAQHASMPIMTKSLSEQINEPPIPNHTEILNQNASTQQVSIQPQQNHQDESRSEEFTCPAFELKEAGKINMTDLLYQLTLGSRNQGDGIGDSHPEPLGVPLEDAQQGNRGPPTTPEQHTLPKADEQIATAAAAFSDEFISPPLARGPSAGRQMNTQYSALHQRQKARPLVLESNQSLAGLQILVSEKLMEGAAWLVMELNSRYSISCIDVPLQAPISIIVDNSTCVCLLMITTLLDRMALKEFVRALTDLACKFKVIWVVVVTTINDPTMVDQGSAYYEATISLYQALSRFPTKVLSRETSSATLSSMIHAIATAAAKEAFASNDYADKSYFRRSYLSLLNSTSFISHCDFLQLFPTVNFMSAVQLLSVFHLSDLVLIKCAESAYRRTQGMFSPPLDPDALHSLFTLVRQRAGLQDGSTAALQPQHT